MAELWLALQDRSLNSLERLKVASYLWKQESVRNRDWSVLLTWAFDEICKAYNRRAKSHPPEDVRCKLWQLLSVMLESTATSDVELWAGEASPNTHFFLSACDALNGASTPDSDAVHIQTAGHVLKCLHSILKAAALPPTLHKFETVVSLLQAYLDLVAVALTTSNEILLNTRTFLPLEQLLKYFVYLQGSHGNPKKVFTSICQQLLPAVLRVKYYMSKHQLLFVEGDAHHVFDCINAQFEKLLMALFSRDHLAEFTSAVAVEGASAAATQKRSATSYVRLLFSTLSDMGTARGGENCSAVVAALPDIYEAFLCLNSEIAAVSKDVEFKFLNKLLTTFDMARPQPHTTTAAASDSDIAMETGITDVPLERVLRRLVKPGAVDTNGATTHLNTLNALCKCLQLVWKFGVYQVAEDASSGCEQFDLFQQLGKGIIERLDNNCLLESCACDCLAVLMRLNHKILEPWLPSLWVMLMVARRSLTRDALGEECVTIFSKLRQLPQFVKKLLQSLNLLGEIAYLSVSTTPMFFPSTELLFVDRLSSLPPGQCMEILHLLLSHLMEICCSVSGLDIAERLVLLLPPLEKAADILRLTLSHLPRELWGGKLKDEALQLLRDVSSCIVLPLITACTRHNFNARLSSFTLLLASEVFDLVAHLNHLHPSLLTGHQPLKPVWNGDLNILIPEQWTDVSIEEFNSLGRLLMTKIALLQLKFYPTETSASPRQLLDSVLDLGHLSALPTTKAADWTGQLLDVKDENGPVAFWSLLLSQLPFIYGHLNSDHLEIIAEKMVAAVMEEGVTEGEEDKGSGATLVKVVGAFLESEGFVEMMLLQEMMLNKVCTYLSSHLKGSLPKPIRKALKSVSSDTSSNTSPSNFIASLDAVMKHGLEALRDPPTEEKAAADFDQLFRTINLPLMYQVMRSFQLCSLSQVSLLHSLNVFTVLHIAMATLTHQCCQGEAAATQLEELNYLLSWLVHSFVRVTERDAKFSRGTKRKRRASTAEKMAADSVQVPSFTPLFSVFSLYLYEHMTQIQVHDKPSSSLLASSMVAMEITVNAIMRMDGCPGDLLEKVVRDLQHKPKDSSRRAALAAAEKCIYIIANVSCKLLASSSKSHGTDSGSESEVYPSLLLEHVVDAIEKLVARKKRKKMSSSISLEVVQEHPVLLSTLALLLLHSPQLVSTRHVEIISLLCQSAKEESPTVPAQKRHAQYELFCGMVDLLVLPAAIAARSQSSLSSDDEEEETDPQLMEVAGEEEREGDHNECDHSKPLTLLLLSWERLQSLLKCTFSEALQLKQQDGVGSLLHCLKHFHSSKTAGEFEKGRKMDMLHLLCEQTSKAMSVLLAAASCEELQVMLEQLLSVEDQISVPLVLQFCFSWCVVISVKLPQEKKSLIRKHLQRVLLVCQSIALQHSSNSFAVSLMIQLVAHFVSIPTSVGLDHTSLLLALELCEFSSKLDNAAAYEVTASLVLAETDLLSAVLRQHVVMANSAPTPIVTTVYKLLKGVVKLGQAVTEVEGSSSDARLEVCVNCARKVSRLMEMLSQKLSFTKFAVYVVHVFLTSSQVQGSTMHDKVKEAILPGVFNLLKLCTANDIAFIKASVDMATRDSFQTLMDEYQRYHKFGGKV